MLKPLNADDSARLREYFQASGYTEEAVYNALDTRIPLPACSPRMPTLLVRTAGKTPFDILARCFFLA